MRVLGFDRLSPNGFLVKLFLSHHTRLPFMERLVGILLFLAAANFLLVLITGGYAFAIGPFRVSAHHLRNPLLLFLVFTMVKVWLQGKRMGIPAAVRPEAPYSFRLFRVQSG